MKIKVIHNSCNACNHTESHDEIVCDVCGTQLSSGGYIIQECGNKFPIEMTFNGIECAFCNWQCLLKFILEEIKKENPRTDIEFGKGDQND